MEQMKKQIRIALDSANTVQEAVQAVHALEQSSKEFHEFINESIIIRTSSKQRQNSVPIA